MNVAATTGPDLSLQHTFPLSLSQTYVWLGQAVSPDQSWFNLEAYVDIDGVIDPRRLIEAIQYCIADTDSWRTVIDQSPHGPVQRLLSEAGLIVPLLDFRAEPDPRSAASAWMQADGERPFDLGCAPLVRYALLRVGTDNWLLHGVGHHLVADAFSATLSERHLASLYGWLLQGGARPQPPLSSLAVLEEDEAYRASGQEARDRGFWLTEVRNRPEPCTLSGRSPVRGGRQIHARFGLPSATARALSTLGNSHRASLAAVIIAAVAVYIGRLTGADELVLGIPVNGRPSPRRRRILGLMANVLPLRLKLDRAEAFSSLVGETARRMRAALRHQRYPMGALRQELGLTPDQPDIFGTLVNMFPAEPSHDFAGASGRIVRIVNGRADDLLIAANPDAAGCGIEIVFSANAANYTPSELAGHMAAFATLLQDAAAAPNKPAGMLSLMPGAHRERLLQAREPTVEPATLLGLFESQAARTPDAAAILCGGNRLDYRELDARADLLARRLRRPDVEPSSLFGLCIGRKPEAIVALLAIMKAGGAYVPLDLAMPPARLKHILDTSRPVLVVGDADDLTRLPPGTAFCSFDHTAPAPQEVGGSTGAPARLQPSDLAYVIFTSGSTGEPKGVMVSHQGIGALAASHVARFAVGPRARVLQFASLAFDASVAEFATAWGAGAALVLAPPDALAGPALGNLMETAQVSHATLPPAVLATLAPRGLPLECLAVAGDACPPALAAAWSGLTRVINAYGPTEATVCVTLSDDFDGNGMPIGRPIAGTRIYVLDAGLQPVPEGIAGEICIAGDSVALGYLNQPDLTVARFAADPFGPTESRLYRSGDRGRWRPDGQLEFLGRADRQLKIRGMRVEPAEIEAALRSLAEVTDAAVVGRGGDRPGETRLVAYVVAAPGQTTASPELHAQLSCLLPPHMLPSAFVQLTALPINASGKLDRHALPEPGREAFASACSEPPNTMREAEVAAIWQDLLGVDQVGRHDNFFALGGHSLLLISLSVRLRQRGWAVDLPAFLNDPTLAGLVTALTDLEDGTARDDAFAPCSVVGAASAPDIVQLAGLDQRDIDGIAAGIPGGRANLQDVYPLTPLQEGIVFHHRLATGRDLYVTSALLSVAGGERMTRLLRALQATIDRHDILRTSFAWEGLDEPVQVVWQRAELRVVALEDAPGDVRERLWRQTEGGARIDLRQAPLIRLHRAWDHARGEWCALLRFHHAITDHVTVERVLAELRAPSDDADADRHLPSGFRAAAVAARRMMSAESHAGYFRSRLSDIDAPTAPFGVHHLETEDDEVDEARLSVSPDLATALHAQSSRCIVTCAALVHAAWALVLARTTGRPDIVFGTVLSGRVQASAATAMGLLANTLPLRLSLQGMPIAMALKETQGRLVELLTHEQASLALAQNCSGVDLPAPLFTTLLNYRHSSGTSPQVTKRDDGLRILRTQERSHYPIMVAVDAFADGFELTVQAPHHIGAPRVAALMMSALGDLIDALDAPTPAIWDTLAWPPEEGLRPQSKGDRKTAPCIAPTEAPALPSRSADAGPLTPTECRLASIWRGILHVDSVRQTDDFFALGGHSLSALRVATQVREHFGLAVPLKTLFICRTLEALADRLDHDMRDGTAASTILPPIERVAHRGATPLSFSQERMWVIQSLATESSAYNMSAGLMISGQLDIAALESAVAALCIRHEVLRAVIRTVDGRPVQEVSDEAAATLETVDLRGSGESAETEALALAEKRLRAPFDLAHDQMLRAHLFRLADERFFLVFAVHHVMADQWSIGILGRELAALYNARIRGCAPLLETPRVSYRDYALWQRSQMHASAFSDQMAFWRRQLSDLPTLDLPTDRPYPIMPSYRGATYQMPIPAGFAEQISGQASRLGATLFMTMLSVWAVLLHRWCAQTDIPIAVPVANRTQSATEDMVGTFVNTVILRLDLSGDPSFDGLLQHGRTTAVEAFANQDIPFDWLVRDIAQKRSTGRAPLAQVMFNVVNTPMHGVSFDGLDWQPVILDRGGAQFDLGVTVDIEVSRTVSFEYSTDLFDRATVAALAAAYFALLESACGCAETPILQLAMLPAADAVKLRQWNGHATLLPQMTYPGLFRAQVARTPHERAVSCGDETMSYAELDARSDTIARTLRGHGASPGMRVALCMRRTLTLPAALIGILKSGAAYVPLDTDYPPARLAFMLADSGCSLLLTDGSCAAGIDSPADVQILDLGSMVADGGETYVPPGADQRDPAYVIYTSGSTGQPKGVIISHGALVNFLLSMKQRPGLMSGDVLASVTTVSFDIAALEIYLPLMVGATVDIVPRATASDGAALAERLASSGATVMQATPATWRLLIEAGWRGSPALRAFCGGEALSRELADELLDRVGAVWNLYGPTETTIWSSQEKVTRGGRIAIGQPIANTQIHVLDGKGQQLPIGFAGEIWIGGAGVALGYLNRPALTAERFVADPFAGQEGALLYRTGDIGLWSADGTLLHRGRADQQVKIRGFRIETGEVESALSAHPSVRQAVVIAREAQPGDQRLVAYVLYEDGEDLTASEARRHLRRSLPDFMIPSIVVALASLPLTPNGKIDRGALPDPFKAPHRTLLARREPPSPGLEQTIASIWRSVLGVPEVFAEDNFFEIGGHSLLALRVSSAVRKGTGLHLDPRVLFFQSLRQLVGTIANEGDFPHV